MAEGNNGRPAPPAETRWKPGQSGNPGGRPRGALSGAAVCRRRAHVVDPTDPEGRTHYEIAVDAVLAKAKGGDVIAFRELNDRMYGKARQTVEVTTEARDKIEREVARIIEEAAGLGEPVTRLEALAALAEYYPPAGALIEAEGGEAVN